MILSIERVLRFVTVAEQSSFTRAAALLRIDQPWLSRQIMQLEDQLGVTLFDRSGSRIALTVEGAEFFACAKEVTEAADRARQKAEEMRRRSQSALRIGVGNATYTIEGRKRLINSYTAFRPKIILEYSAYQFSDQVIEKVSSGDLDFGIVFGPVDGPNLESRVLDVAEATLGVPKEDPLAAKSTVTLADLKNRRIAVGLRDRSCPRYLKIYSWMEEVGAIPVFVPEGRRYIFDVAESERLLVVCYTPADKLPDNFTRRAFNDSRFLHEVCLIRGKRMMPTAGEYLWRLSHELGGARDGAALAADAGPKASRRC
jgi:DNA-binding transcriptional LysR family regulator